MENYITIPEKLRRFNSAVALWNVLGHVDDLVHFLAILNSLLVKGGKFIFDINNRQNIVHYGVENFLKNENRVNNGEKFLSYELIVSGEKTRVKILSLDEITTSLQASGFEVSELTFVNYDTGQIVNTKYEGQIFIVATKRD